MVRLTQQRKLVYSAVTSVTTHPTADEVYQMVAKECQSISKGTVYRILGQLADEGEILRIQVGNNKDHFDLTTKPHAHFLCEKCSRMFDYSFQLSPLVSELEGCQVKSIEIIAHGVCFDCLHKNK